MPTLAEFWHVWRQRLSFITWLLKWLIYFPFRTLGRLVRSSDVPPEKRRRVDFDPPRFNEKDVIINFGEPTVEYYNPRLEPKNYLHGPLSSEPATRLRQLLARPGIIVCVPAPYTVSMHYLSVL